MLHDARGAGRRWNAAQIQLIILLQSVFIIDGIDTQLMSVALPSIIRDWQKPLSEFGNAMGAGHLGALLGTPFAGALSDRFGRRPVLILGAAIFGIMTIALSFATTPDQLALLHLFAGLGLGGCVPPALALITECTPERRRGMAVALSMVCPPIGIALAGVLASIIIPAYGWRPLFVLCGVLPLLSAGLVLLFLPESPAFLARSGKHEARLATLVEALDILRPLPPANGKRTGFFAALGTIFGGGRWLSVCGLFTAFVLEYLTMSLILAWLPTFFSNYGYPQRLAATSITAYSLSGIAGILFTGWAITRYGERLVTSGLAAGGIAVMLLLAGLLPSATNLGGITTFAIFVMIGLAGVMINGLMTALFTGTTGAFPPLVRATGIGLAATVARFGAMFGGKIGPQVITFHGTAGYFVALAAILTLVLIVFNLSCLARRRDAV